MDDKTIEALGRLSAAPETTERARGHLYSSHQLTGTADLMLDEAIALLREAGHHEHASRVQRELLGRNVLPGRLKRERQRLSAAAYADRDSRSV